jgi:acetyl-CoA synthetase
MTSPSASTESMLVENRVFPPSEAMVKAARISGMGAYNALCAEAEKDFEGFWRAKTSSGTSHLPRHWTSPTRRFTSGLPTVN